MKNRHVGVFGFEVQVPDANDNRNGHDVIEWLTALGKEPDWHFDIDMHGGRLGYTSFWFKDRLLAIRTRLMWG